MKMVTHEMVEHRCGWDSRPIGAKGVAGWTHRRDEKPASGPPVLRAEHPPSCCSRAV